MSKSPPRRGKRPIARAEFDALRGRVEDLEDTLLLRAAEGRGPTRDGLPVELAKRLFAGEHPLRIWREHRALTQTELAAASGVAVSYLSEIETRRKQGSVAAYRALARALDLDVDDPIGSDR